MPKPYFKDDLFRFQTYISGCYEIGYHELVYRTNVQEMAPVWDDYRGRGVSVGILGTVDRFHSDLKKNYDTRYLGHHDPRDDLGTSSGYGTFAAGIVAADNDGRGLVGVAPDAKVFSWTTDPREKPDVVVMQGQNKPYGAVTHAGVLFDENGRGGLGTITVANTPFAFASIFRPSGSRDGEGEMVGGFTNSEYGIHSDRGVITTVGTSLYGYTPLLQDRKEMALGDMLLVTAPVGTSSYVGQPIAATPPFDDPAYTAPAKLAGMTLAWQHQGAAVATLGLDHRDEAGSQGRADDLGGLWSWVAERRLGLPAGGIDTSDHMVDEQGRGASAVLGGAVALMLDANPDLGWRDVQAILAYSADPVKVGHIPFVDELAWTARWTHDVQTWNGAGLIHSGMYGFGALDTRAAVRLAETWGEANEGPRTSRNEVVVKAVPVAGSDLSVGPLSDFTSDAPNSASIAFKLPKDIEIEHVALDIAFRASGAYDGSDYPYGDQVGLSLISPGGTRSHLAGISHNTFRTPDLYVFDTHQHAGSSVDRAFTTRAFWGREGEAGDLWQLRIEAAYGDELRLDISDVSLRFYGAPADEDDTYVYTDSLTTMMKSKAGLGLEGTIADNTGHGGTIRDGKGFDTLNASAITDDARLSAAPGGEGRADGQTLYRLASGTAMDRIYAGDGDDRVTGWRAGERLHAGRGDDRVEGEDGEDYLWGEDGDDKLYGGSGGDRLWGGKGSDQLWGGDGEDKLYGSDGGDRLLGGDGSDWLLGGNDKDKLYGSGGGDRLLGGDESDQLWGGDGKDKLYGGDGSDRLLGGGGSDRLLGGSGRDRLDGSTGDDQLKGGSGSDRLDGGSGADMLWGQSGDDVFVMVHGAPDVVRDFQIGADRVDASEVASSFGGLRILDRGDDALIEADGAVLVLEDTDAGQLHAHHFLF